VVLRLDAGVYPRAALERAAAAFAAHAGIALGRDGRDHLVRFTDLRAPAAELLDEFANFALGCLAGER